MHMIVKSENARCHSSQEEIKEKISLLDRKNHGCYISLSDIFVNTGGDNS
jgi:hypothetical protein